ncbi:LysR family transcriptional regulator [Pararhizobium sp. A13]|uniref:LysR family transcriptional regulator n=1 Tax=Pararhizobium sp. A13 TaxID=3133975 RepID=UPI00311ABC8F
MDSFSSLAVFVQAAESRSFTATGKQLGVSASAIGKAISRLEDRLKVRLFNRSTRSVALTAEGALFLDRCKKIFEEVQAAELELARASSAPRGKLKISLPLIDMLLMPTITKFAKAYPEIELELDYSDRLVDVIEEGFDAVVRTGDASDSRLKTKTIGTFSHKIVGSPGYFKQHSIPQVPADLLGHICLHHRFPSTGKYEPWPLNEDGAPIEIELPKPYVASTLQPLIALAEGGLGLCCVPLFTVQRQLENGSLVAVLDRFLRNSRPLRILWPATRHASPKVEAFVNFMAKNLFASNG